MARYRYLQSFEFYGPFKWPVCEECQRYVEPIQEMLEDILCLWCGVNFTSYSIKTSRHPKVCPRGPNLSHSRNFNWNEKRCQCAEEKELKEILGDFILEKKEEDEEEDWSSIGLPPPRPRKKCWCGHFH